jgi:hypothetical protein
MLMNKKNCVESPITGQLNLTAPFPRPAITKKYSEWLT